MTESEVIYLLAGLASGAVLGVLLTLGFNKVRGGRVSAAGVRKEMDEYQAQVEAHFDETSKKFKSMAEQYKDLYQHLSVGATSLCRPDHIAPGLTDQSDPLQAALKIEAKTAEDDAKAQENKKSKDADKSTESARQNNQNKKVEQAKSPAEKPKDGNTKSAGSGQKSGAANRQDGNAKQSGKVPSGGSKTEPGKSNETNNSKSKTGSSQRSKPGVKAESKSGQKPY